MEHYQSSSIWWSKHFCSVCFSYKIIKRFTVFPLQAPSRRSEVRVPSASWRTSLAAGTKLRCPQPSPGRTLWPNAASASPTSYVASPLCPATTPTCHGTRAWCWSWAGWCSCITTTPAGNGHHPATSGRRSRGWPAAGMSGGGTAWRRSGRTPWWRWPTCRASWTCRCIPRASACPSWMGCCTGWCARPPRPRTPSPHREESPPSPLRDWCWSVCASWASRTATWICCSLRHPSAVSRSSTPRWCASWGRGRARCVGRWR